MTLLILDVLLQHAYYTVSSRFGETQQLTGSKDRKLHPGSEGVGERIMTVPIQGVTNTKSLRTLTRK